MVSSLERKFRPSPRQGEWDEIRQSINYYIYHLRSVSTLREGINIIYDIICFILCKVIKYCKVGSNSRHSYIDNGVSEDRLQYQQGSDLIFYHIATTYTAFYFYIIIGLSMLTHQLWILHGISLYIVSTITYYIIPWIIYIVNDPELINNYKYIKSWIYILIHESEDIINGDAAWKLATTYLMIQQAPTGMSYIRYIIRYKTRLLRKQFIMELGENRYFGTGGLRISAFTNKLAASILRSNSSDNDMNNDQMFHEDGDGYYEEIWLNDKNDVELVLQQKKRRRR